MPEHGSSALAPQDRDYRTKVSRSFDRQRVMETLGASLDHIDPGVVHLSMPYRADLTQQHGFLHAGIITTILDSACGYAAFSLMPAEAAVLSVEFKVNLLAPAQGDRFRFEGRVRKAGRTITVCDGEAWATQGEQAKLVATMTGTMMAVYDRPGVEQ